MKKQLPIHPDFEFHLSFKDKQLIELFKDLRTFVISLHPESNELLYHTHALTSVFSISQKLGDGYCMIPIYTNHLNLGFNKGTLLDDPHQLLKGTGKLIRHIPIATPENYRNERVEQLMKSAIAFAIKDMDTPTKVTSTVFSKIKSKK